MNAAIRLLPVFSLIALVGCGGHRIIDYVSEQLEPELSPNPPTPIVVGKTGTFQLRLINSGRADRHVTAVELQVLPSDVASADQPVVSALQFPSAYPFTVPLLDSVDGAFTFQPKKPGRTDIKIEFSSDSKPPVEPLSITLCAVAAEGDTCGSTP